MTGFSIEAAKVAIFILGAWSAYLAFRVWWLKDRIARQERLWASHRSDIKAIEDQVDKAEILANRRTVKDRDRLILMLKRLNADLDEHTHAAVQALRAERPDDEYEELRPGAQKS